MQDGFYWYTSRQRPDWRVCKVEADKVSFIGFAEARPLNDPSVSAFVVFGERIERTREEILVMLSPSVLEESIQKAFESILFETLMALVERRAEQQSLADEQPATMEPKQ